MGRLHIHHLPIKYNQETDRPKERSLKVSRTAGKSKESILKFRNDFQNLLIKLTVKASSEKTWIIYEFPFSLNPSDKPNTAQAWKNYSSLYSVSTEDQFQANSKKILEAAI